jgi:hypothetical protein
VVDNKGCFEQKNNWKLLKLKSDLSAQVGGPMSTAAHRLGSCEVANENLSLSLSLSVDAAAK